MAHAATPATLYAVGARSRISSPRLKIVRGVLGAFVLVGVLAMANLANVGCSASRTTDGDESRATEGGESAGTITIETTDGPVSFTPDMKGVVKVEGIPIYPGAQPTGMDKELTMGGMGPASGADYHTPDAMDRVAAFYEKELAPKAKPIDRNVEILFRFEEGGMAKRVQIVRHPGFGGTRIGIYQMPK